MSGTRKPRHRGAAPHQTPLALLLLAPALMILTAFGIGPAFYAVYLSFFQIRGRDSLFIGWANYVEAFQSDAFWDSFAVTLYYALGTIPATIILSFLIANALVRIPRFQSFFRTAFFLPFVTSVVAAAMIWRVLFEPQFGLANHVLGLVGLPAQQWLLEPQGVLHVLTRGAVPPDVGPSLALCSVILFEIWRTSGFVVVILLAGLTNVSRELEDAARLDGASDLRVTWSITVPLLSPTLFFVTIISLIGAFQAFANLYALTGNGRGPLDTTQNLTVYIYTTFYENGRLGYGAAVATLVCVALIGLTLAQWRVFGRRVFYQ